MPLTISSDRCFQPGTTGWTASDLDDPRIEAEWLQGRHEIIEGVLTTMPAAYYAGSRSLYKLMSAVTRHLVSQGQPDGWAPEADIFLGDSRVVKADAIFMTPADEARLLAAARAAGQPNLDRARVVVPPTLIVESVSIGHESHDRQTKRTWYAEFKVPNYWILDSSRRSLECLVLDIDSYRVDVQGSNSDELLPALFPGLTIRLSGLWTG